MTLPTLNIRKIVPDEPSVAPEGFAGQLRRLTLADLVQLECLSGTRATIIVRSSGKVGQLHFDNGELVHSATGAIVGDAAALEILSWTSGTFALSDGPWPGRATVHQPWQHLLMTAAQRADEERRARDSSAPPEEGASQLFELTTFRDNRTKVMFSEDELGFDDMPPDPAQSAAPPQSRRRLSGTSTPPKPDTTAQGTLKAASPQVDPSIRRLLCLDASGRATRRIGDCRTLDQATPTLTRLASEIGDALGLEGFREALLERSSCRWYVRRDAKGRSAAAELEPNTPVSCVDELLVLEV